MLEKIEADLKTALLGGEKLKVSTLRMLKSTIQNKKIELKQDLTDEDVIKAIRAEAKKRVEAIEMYNKAGRDEQSAQETAELAILEEYLPKQLDDSELASLVGTVKAELGEDTHMGQMIQEVIKRAEGRVDGKRVAEAVRNSL
jgi:hypothetical protein